jgi:hypothetical protein
MRWVLATYLKAVLPRTRDSVLPQVDQPADRL